MIQRQILLIDKSLSKRELYQYYLYQDQSSSYNFWEAESAEAALQLCATQLPDCIVLNYLLPDRNGLEFLHELNILIGENCPPIIMVNKPGNEAIAIQAFRLGVQDYLIESEITPESFYSATHTAIENFQRRQQLHKSEARYREILEDQTELICRFLPDCTLTFVNGAYSRYFGSTPEDLIGQNFLNLIPASDRSRVQQEITELSGITLENREIVHEHQVLKLNGEIGWQQWTNRAIFNCNEELIEFQAVGRDISEQHAALRDRQQAEQSLRQSEDFNRRILETIPDCIKLLDLEGKILYINSIGQDLLDLHNGSYLNTKLVEFWQEGDLQQLEKALDIAISGKTSKFQGYCPARNGTPKWWEVIITPAFDANQQVERLLSVSRDISDRKQTEAMVQQQLAQIEAIYATAPVGLCFLDHELRFVQMNERLAEINGLRVSEQLGRTIWEILPELAETQAPIFEQVLQTGEPILDYEVQGVTPAQPEVKRHWLSSYYPLKREDGEIIGINITVLEITERKQAEAERERLLAEAEAAKEAAERANSDKDEFVAVVAHELRSPINAVAGWTQLLRTRQFDPATINRAYEAIERGTQTQVQLIEDLLDISRIACGTLRLTFAPVNLRIIIQAALSLVRPMADTRQIHLETQLTEIAQVSGDLNRLQQIIVNLLNNAIKFTPEGGQVTIILELVESQAKFIVKDTGQGISPEFLPSIFERFQQAQKNAGSKNGLGLGLAIVKNLVELHNGTIIAQSPGIGEGATFTVCLPLIEKKQENGEQKKEVMVMESQTTALAGIRILAVDDEPDSLELLRFILENAGAEVQTATNGSAAMEVISEFNPDLLVSDIAMPDLNGHELLQQIRKMYSQGHIPAIALTAYASSSDRDYALRVGFEKYFSKPIEPEVLVQAIVSLIRD